MNKITWTRNWAVVTMIDGKKYDLTVGIQFLLILMFLAIVF